MDIKKFAEKIAELHYPNKPNAIIDEPYRKVRMNTLKQQIEDEFKILNLYLVMGQSEQSCECYESDNTTAMNCKHCKQPQFMHD